MAWLPPKLVYFSFIALAQEVYGHFITIGEPCLEVKWWQVAPDRFAATNVASVEPSVDRASDPYRSISIAIPLRIACCMNIAKAFRSADARIEIS